MPVTTPKSTGAEQNRKTPTICNSCLAFAPGRGFAPETRQPVDPHERLCDAVLLAVFVDSLGALLVAVIIIHYDEPPGDSFGYSGPRASMVLSYMSPSRRSNARSPI